MLTAEQSFSVLDFPTTCKYVSIVRIQGPPGTGKTTSILALARQLLGAVYREAVLELNASDDRQSSITKSTLCYLSSTLSGPGLFCCCVRIENSFQSPNMKPVVAITAQSAMVNLIDDV